MKISTKGRYALRMLLDLGEHRNDGFIALKEIAERQNISKKYLEQIIPILNQGGMLRTERGAQGGYMLARTPEHYTVGEILRLTEGSLAPVTCLDGDKKDCERASDCRTLALWKEFYDVIKDFFGKKTIKDLTHRENGGEYVI